MRTASPLRYPGGKASLAGLLRDVMRLNGLSGRSIAEPYCGGAGASLSLLYHEDVPGIHLNDKDPAIFDFWWSLVNRPRTFLRRLEDAEVSIEEWRRQRDIYRKPGRQSRIQRGFAAFYLNRANRSGIVMNGGPIGGIEQSGAWKIDARFNLKELRFRCSKVAEYAPRINVSCLDGIDFLKSAARATTFFFVDPPYFAKGQTLYLNALDVRYHSALAELLHSMQSEPWILTYDDCPEIRKLYKDWARVRPFSLRYAASERRPGREVLIAPRWMELPRHQDSLAVEW